MKLLTLFFGNIVLLASLNALAANDQELERFSCSGLVNGNQMDISFFQETFHSEGRMLIKQINSPSKVSQNIIYSGFSNNGSSVNGVLGTFDLLPITDPKSKSFKTIWTQKTGRKFNLSCVKVAPYLD